MELIPETMMPPGDAVFHLGAPGFPAASRAPPSIPQALGSQLFTKELGRVGGAVGPRRGLLHVDSQTPQREQELLQPGGLAGPRAAPNVSSTQ